MLCWLVLLRWITHAAFCVQVEVSIGGVCAAIAALTVHQMTASACFHGFSSSLTAADLGADAIALPAAVAHLLVTAGLLDAAAAVLLLVPDCELRLLSLVVALSSFLLLSLCSLCSLCSFFSFLSPSCTPEGHTFTSPQEG